MRVLLYILLIIAIQGALTRLIPPSVTTSVSPPDLFLLTAVALAFRLRPAYALLIAYGIGFLQDILGHGLLGLHAAGTAGGVLLLLGLRKFLSDQGPLQMIVSVTTAVAGQWLTFLILTYWLRNGLVTVMTLQTVLPSVLVLTLLAAPLMERFATWAFGPRPTAEGSLA